MTDPRPAATPAHQRDPRRRQRNTHRLQQRPHHVHIPRLACKIAGRQVSNLATRSASQHMRGAYSGVRPLASCAFTTAGADRCACASSAHTTSKWLLLHVAK